MNSTNATYNCFFTKHIHYFVKPRFSKKTLHNIYQTEFHASNQTEITQAACAEGEDIACPTSHTQSHYEQLDMTADGHGNDTSLSLLRCSIRDKFVLATKCERTEKCICFGLAKVV